MISFSLQKQAPFYTLFNLAQTEGIAHKLGIAEASAKPVPNIAVCESLVAAMPNAPQITASDRAWYRPSTDQVGMPSKSVFHSSEAYYATLFHELTHSTGHPSRIGRGGVES
ncbi:MAG: zincin-like metallopeptidase domain-containing protein [Candidatus Acidiferrales bacterium]